MKQVSGTGSIVSGLSILCAAVCAECIPAMLGFVVLAGGGVLWDMLRGERVKHGVHMSGKVKSAGYKGRHEGIKKSPRRSGVRSRRKATYTIHSIAQSMGKVKEGVVGC